MKFPVGGRAILDEMYERNKPLANGSEDDRRSLTYMIAQVFAARYGENWGTKSTTITHPRSKDALAYKLPNGLLDIWDWQNGTTRLPVIHDGDNPSYSAVSHFFVRVDPLDWLATPTIHDDIPGKKTIEELLEELLAEVKIITNHIRDNS